jgi:retinol dehydrogenase-12
LLGVQVSTLGKSVKQGAQTSICAALSGGGGVYYSDCAPKEPHAAAHDAAAGERLWSASAALLAHVAPAYLAL